MTENSVYWKEYYYVESRKRSKRRQIGEFIIPGNSNGKFGLPEGILKSKRILPSPENDPTVGVSRFVIM